jgi:cysteine desulfurase / selenocysteine lyase
MEHVEGGTQVDWHGVRSEFPITRTRAYLFAGGIAPLSRAARAAIESYATLWGTDPVTAYRSDPGEQAQRLREQIAPFLGAGPGDLSILDSTSRGNNVAVGMLAAPAGSNVVVDSTTYPSALAAWLLRPEVEIRHATDDRGAPSVDAVERLVDERTVAVSVSHVCRLTGFRHDLARLARAAHAAGAALVVDAAQSVGAIRVDVEADGVDFLSFGAMKWLLGAPGIAFLYVRPELQERLLPPQVGAGARIEDGALVLAPGGARHELGSLNWLGLEASTRGAALLAERSGEAVEARVLELSGRVVDGLLARGIPVRTPGDPALRAGIVAFESAAPDRLQSFLRTRGVDVWGWEQRRLMRVDPHVYNDEDDLARLFEGLDAFAQLSDN